jgi:hypothetical protein
VITAFHRRRKVVGQRPGIALAQQPADGRARPALDGLAEHVSGHPAGPRPVNGGRVVGVEVDRGGGLRPVGLGADRLQVVRLNVRPPRQSLDELKLVEQLLGVAHVDRFEAPVSGQRGENLSGVVSALGALG